MAISPVSVEKLIGIQRWNGMQGVLTAEDARLAMDAGVDGIIVSNHGGRQLDFAPAAIDVLPSIASAVNRRVPVLMDGGIRRGTDIIKVRHHLPSLASNVVLVFVFKGAHACHVDAASCPAYM